MLGEQLRLVMRASAQPVAIITAFLPPPGSGSESESESDPDPAGGAPPAGSAFLQPKRTYPTHTRTHAREHGGQSIPRTLVHGATLSSFSSVSLDPPRVAFSLRVPSRLADALLHDALATMSSRSPTGSPSGPGARTPPGPHFVVNLLSSQQADIARTYAHPGLAPYDLARHSPAPNKAAPSTNADQAPPVVMDDDSLHPLDTNAIAPSPHARSYRGSVGVPYLVDAVGALACRITRVVDLTVSSSDQQDLGSDDAFRTRIRAAARTPGTILFIAEVCGVDRAPPQRGEDRTPLLYCDRSFVTVDDRAL